MKKMLKKVASKYVDSLAESLSGDGGNKRGGKKTLRNPFVEKEHTMIVSRLPGYFLIFCLLAVLYLLYLVTAPFLTTLIIAAVLTILFYGVYKKLLKFFGGYSRIASAITCLLVVLIIIVPLAAFIVLLAREAIDMYATVSTKIASGALDPLFRWEEGGWLFDLKGKLEPVVDLDGLDLKGMVVTAAQDVSTFLVGQSALIAKNIGALIVDFIIMLFSMFYLFRDGDKFVEKFTILSPLPKKYEKQIYGRIDQTVKAIAFGVFLTAIIQGVIAGIGYTVAGIPNPVFWASATALFSLIPLIGTAAIWFPAAVIVFVLGNYAGGIFLVLWGMFVVGTVDNLVRPYLIGGKSHMYPLLTFFVVLGGLWTFGLKGIVFGPLILVLFLTLLHVYELEYKKVLNK
jgi:predicted PurR-regulated permease PerM